MVVISHGGGSRKNLGERKTCREQIGEKRVCYLNNKAEGTTANIAHAAASVPNSRCYFRDFLGSAGRKKTVLMCVRRFLFKTFLNDY